MAGSRLWKSVKYTLRIVPDRLYIQLYYFARFKKFCNLKNPKTYSEKLNWLKLYDRNPLYTGLVDKYEVKNYVSKILEQGDCPEIECQTEQAARCSIEMKEQIKNNVIEKRKKQNFIANSWGGVHDTDTWGMEFF